MRNDKKDWKDQLASLKVELEENMTEEEKREQRREEQQEKKRRYEFNRRKHTVYEFLAGYKQNSGIFINNFFRNRDFETYCKDKFHGFDFNVSGTILPNVFDNPAFYFEMVGYLRKLEESRIAYFPIEPEYIKKLITVAEMFDLSNPLEEEIVLYRGCSTIDRNGVNGIVSTTTDRKIAEQFSRGTILTIHVPKGTKYLDVKHIRAKEQRRKDYENEILLPPCEYQILSDETVKSGREPNNHTGQTRLLEIMVTPLDILEEFQKSMDNPPEEYKPILDAQGIVYFAAKQELYNYIKNRNQKQRNRNKQYKKTKNKKENKSEFIKKEG